MSSHLEPTVKGDILIVDDVPDNLRVLSAMLTERGYEVRRAINGRLALKVAQAAPPNLILLDIRMEGMDGYEVCQRLKALEQTREIPVIFLSALSDVFDKVKAFQVGGVDYIAKPFQTEEVLARVEHQLTIRQLQRQLQQCNSDLENRVQERTAQLQKALEFEALLKRITDRVRDSLDENQILQAAVQELALNLEVYCCDAALYDLQHRTSTICYEAICSQVLPAKGSVLQMEDFYDIYHQLLQGQYVHCCPASRQSTHVRGNDRLFSILSCPLMDDRGALGDIWLLKAQQDCFNDPEIRLVQQVANQCAIALRQARLYQVAQAQVQELERLNRLKDDFLSTVSHELRTPVSHVRLVTQMLEINLQEMGVLNWDQTSTDKNAQYLQIIKDECQKEIELITDLLDLTCLDAKIEPIILTEIDLTVWISYIAEPFIERAHSQQQVLQVDVSPELPLLMTEQSYLQRILTELLNNACKYTPVGETISVRAQMTAEGIEISVSNSGVEIPESEQQRIFDRFYRIPNNDPWKHGGTGLGLALVKKLVECLGAMIWLEIAEGKTTFRLRLPVHT